MPEKVRSTTSPSPTRAPRRPRHSESSIDMLGSHLSVAGGMVNALTQAVKFSMQTVQIFTKNQRQWSARPLEPAAIDAWRTELHRLGWTSTVSHASYLINLATPEDEHFNRSIDAMTDEIERAEALDIPFLVVHPGSHLNSGEHAGLKRIASALDRIQARTAGYRAMICLETTVGGGAQLGGRFDHLASIRELVSDCARTAVCFDTCHVAAAGYDMSTPDRAKAVFAEFDAIVGLAHLRCFHLNDSKQPMGSHKDRHEHVGRGYVGLEAFRYIMNEPRFRLIPKILETEKDENDAGEPWDAVNLRMLRSLVAS